MVHFSLSGISTLRAEHFLGIRETRWQTELQSSWVPWPRMKLSPYRPGQGWSGPYYSNQCLSQCRETSPHECGLGRRRESHFLATLTQNLTSATVSWGKMKNVHDVPLPEDSPLTGNCGEREPVSGCISLVWNFHHAKLGWEREAVGLSWDIIKSLCSYQYIDFPEQIFLHLLHTLRTISRDNKWQFFKDFPQFCWRVGSLSSSCSLARNLAR